MSPSPPPGPPPTFSSFLLPSSLSISFRRQANPPTPTPPSNTNPYPESTPVPPATSTLRCATCAADLAFAAQIVSKGFTGRHGPAVLVSPPAALATPNCPGTPLSESESARTLVNVRVGRPETRQLVTGSHVVADISCRACGAKVGWKYVDAREPTQRYKVGKYILETARVVRCHEWGDDTQPASLDEGVGLEDDRQGVKSPVVFDSEDEDECDELFSGTWDAETVAKRRNARKAAAARRAKKRQDDLA